MTDSKAASSHFLAIAFGEQVKIWAKEQNADPYTQTWISALACYLSAAVSSGHVYLPLQDTDAIISLAPELKPDMPWPSLDKIKQILVQSHLVDTPDNLTNKPMVLDSQNRLYLHRYYAYEDALAKKIQSMNISEEGSQKNRLYPYSPHLDHYFGKTGKQDIDWQKIAAALALRQRLTIISGGPGTGKTTTVANILACFLEQQHNQKKEQSATHRIALAAPTGKAAMRMMESIKSQISRFPEAIQQQMPKEAFTLHRLLGMTFHPGIFRHHANNPLPLDMLVVDEASMIDLALAYRLFDAIPSHARLILLGDKDQLAAVEAGSVFSDLSANPALSPDCISDLAKACGIDKKNIISPKSDGAGPKDSTIWLTKNFRFGSNSTISQLASAIRDGQFASAKNILNNPADNAVTWISETSSVSLNNLLLKDHFHLKNYLTTLKKHPDDPKKVFESFESFRILCAVREGRYGVSNINAMISAYVKAQLAIPSHQEWYIGRPVMIRQNNYSIGLFNGDIGIVLPNENNALVLYFPSSNGEFRTISPGKLPDYETAFAMTIHKSQGSEFDSTMILIPHQHSPIITKELLYTAVTRAKKQVLLFCNESVLEKGIQKSVRKPSGLMDRIQQSQD